jgi:hypothetical protein
MKAHHPRVQAATRSSERREGRGAVCEKFEYVKGEGNDCDEGLANARATVPEGRSSNTSIKAMTNGG